MSDFGLREAHAGQETGRTLFPFFPEIWWQKVAVLKE